MSLPLDLLEEQLRRVGYCGLSGATVRQYDYVTETAGKQSADLVAFGDPQHFDVSTACIVIALWSSRQSRLSELEKLGCVGAPIALFAATNHVEIWPVVSPGSRFPERLERLTYGQLPNYFRQHKEELAPRSLLNAKQGSRQLSFIEVDSSLESFARTTTKKTLIRQFTQAIASLPQELRARYPEDITRLAIWILAARILQDKLGYQHNVYSDFRAVDGVVPLLETAQNFFPNYFTGVWEHIAQVGPEVLESFYEGLSREFTFRSLTNDMLAYFYENTLVTKEMQENLGVYYTPQKTIAERILHRLPIEDLPLEKRTVLDGTCGSGNLLLAAYGRLHSLLPHRWASQTRHEYLLQRVWGIDIDSFACEIARLSLLLYSLPEGDSWKVRAGNVLEDTPQELFGDSPSIIVGNPPFQERSVGKRVQKAAVVLDRYLEWLEPNGLLGVVVPVTFLHNPSGEPTRNRLLKSFDIMEVWHLDEGSIPGSSVATAVILARKLHRSRSIVDTGLTRVEKMGRIEQEQVGPQRELVGKYTVPYLVSQSRWLSDPQLKMDSSVFDHVWQRITNVFPTITPHFCGIFNGIKPGKEARLTHFSERWQGEGWRPVLYKNTRGDTVAPFQINWANQTTKYVKYPSNELERPRDLLHFESTKKVITNATRNPDNPWRFYAAIDTQRLVVTENFNYILPREAAAEEITAVLNSTLANAWYSSHNYQRDVNLNYLKRLPFPYFGKRQSEMIHSLVHRIQHLLQSDNPQLIIERLRQYTDNLDDIVFEAYGLNEKEKQEISSWMGQFQRPGRWWEGMILANNPPPAPYRGRQWEVTCEVNWVSADDGTMSLWILGMSDSDDSVEVPIPGNMPGWALRPGVAFVASLPWEQRYHPNLSEANWLEFRALEYGHLSEEELVSLLSKQQ